MPSNEKNRSVSGNWSGKASQKPKGKNYLLVIGIDEYQHKDIPNLNNAVLDAKAVKEILLTKYQFEKANLTELYNTDATKRNIYRALRKLTEQITSNDNFILYYSGHGEYDKVSEEGYWIPSEAELREESDYIPNSVIKKKLAVIDSHHTFLMADSCFSGSLFASGVSRSLHTRYEEDPSRWGLTAGRNEIVSDGEPGEHSPFAEGLLGRLKSNIKSIGVSELCQGVKEFVVSHSQQAPIGEPLLIEGHKSGEFFLHLKKDEIADWKEAKAAGTLAAFEFFVSKYPESQYLTEANTQIKSLKAATHWERCEAITGTDLVSLNSRLGLVHQYVDLYEGEAHYSDALNLGRLLEYQMDFEKSKPSEFSLRHFLKGAVPPVPGAAAVRQSAEDLLANFNNSEWTNLIEQDNTTVKNTSQDLPSGRDKKEKQVNNKKENISNNKNKKDKQAEKIVKTEGSFFSKYGKILIPVILLPLLFFGGYQLLKPDPAPPLKEELPLEQEKQQDLQAEYDKLIEEAVALFKKEKYADAKSVFKEAVGKVKNDQKARIGVKSCEKKLRGGRNPRLLPPEELLKNIKPGTSRITDKATVEGLTKNNKPIFETKLNISKLNYKGLTYGTFDYKGQTYDFKKMSDGKIWMAENLNVEVQGSWCYNNDPAYCKKYGRFYSLAGAEKACPPGWRLPTDSDWWGMMSKYGTVYNDYENQTINKSSNAGKDVYYNLILNGSSQFDALFAGYRNHATGSFFMEGQTATFVTATKARHSDVFSYNFDKRKKQVSRGMGNRELGRSCRCVREE